MTTDGWLTSPYMSDKGFEENLLGYLLWKPQAAREAFGFITPGHFQFPATQEVAQAMAALVARGRLPDVQTTLAEMRVRSGDRTVGTTPVEVTRWYGGGPVIGSLHEACVRLRDMARRRQVAYALHDALDQLTHEPEFDLVRASVYGVLDSVDDAHRHPDEDAYAPVVGEVVSRYETFTDDALPTGFVGLDQRMTGGIPRGSLVVLGARTSVGKTALAATMAVEWARAGRKVSFISLEMDRLSIGQRLLGAAGTVPVARLNARSLHAHEEQRLVEASQLALPICTDDTARSLAQIRARASQHRRVLDGLDVVIVDYVQLMDMPPRKGEGRYEVLGRISRGLKALAKDLRVVVLALAQLRRETDDRKGQPPRLSDLRESGNLEQDADQVWLLWRPERRGVPTGKVELVVAKNRQGPRAKVVLDWNPEPMTFVEMGDSDE